jgi:hypothetical protein
VASTAKARYVYVDSANKPHRANRPTSDRNSAVGAEGSAVTGKRFPARVLSGRRTIREDT